jgi:hypothetical protein
MHECGTTLAQRAAFAHSILLPDQGAALFQTDRTLPPQRTRTSLLAVFSLRVTHLLRREPTCCENISIHYQPGSAKSLLGWFIRSDECSTVCTQGAIPARFCCCIDHT